MGIEIISSFQTFVKKFEKIKGLKGAQEGPIGHKMKRKSRGEKQKVMRPMAQEGLS